MSSISSNDEVNYVAVVLFFFFKQKTAYEVRISDWSSDVCSSDLFGRRTVENSAQGLDHGWGNVMLLAGAGVRGGRYYGSWPGLTLGGDGDLSVTTDYRKIGRASGRDRVCQYG